MGGFAELALRKLSLLRQLEVGGGGVLPSPRFLRLVFGAVIYPFLTHSPCTMFLLLALFSSLFRDEGIQQQAMGIQQGSWAAPCQGPR